MIVVYCDAWSVLVVRFGAGLFGVGCGAFVLRFVLLLFRLIVLLFFMSFSFVVLFCLFWCCCCFATLLVLVVWIIVLCCSDLLIMVIVIGVLWYICCGVGLQVWGGRVWLGSWFRRRCCDI